jgi:hypothetical protein
VDTGFGGTFPVHYGQAYVLSHPTDVNSDLEEAFAGQRNGLLGASVPGQLWITTGLHTGRVRLQLTKVDVRPLVDDRWQEVVEASFTPGSTSAALTGWGGEARPVPLLLEMASYRVRLCASHMDEARDSDTILEGEAPIDAYLLMLWKASPAADRILKQTSAVAAYWHEWAQALPAT